MSEEGHTPEHENAGTIAAEPELGLSLWTARRQAWTGTVEGAEDAPSPEVLQRRLTGRLTKGFGKLSEASQLKVYEKFVEERRGFSRPINLSQLLPILKLGWIKTGIWPKGQEAPMDSS